MNFAFAKDKRGENKEMLTHCNILGGDEFAILL